MRGTARRAALIVLALAWTGPDAGRAVIIDTGDGAGNLEAPEDDPGWAHVGRRKFSGVYLGRGWVLTARHVGVGDLELAGAVHPAVPGSGLRIESASGVPADLLVFRIASDPGLSSLRLASREPVPGTPVVMIGVGRDRGPPFSFTPRAPGVGPVSGWHWGNGRSLRWGANQIVRQGFDLKHPKGHTRAFAASFEPGGGGLHEAVASVGDSGGAVFAKGPRGWELAGVMVAVLTYPQQPRSTALAGNATIAADLYHYREQILAAIAVPQCRDGLDDDGDGLTDFPEDPGCRGADDPFEAESPAPGGALRD